MPRTQTERLALRNSHPDSWIPTEKGDTIMGKIVDVTEAWSDQRRDPSTGKPGSWYPLLTILVEEANGYEGLPRELKVHAFGAVLYNEIMRKQPNIGERIRIVYQGTGEAKSGQNPPELYVVRAAGGSDVAQRAYARIGGSSDTPQGGGGQPVQPELAADEAADDIPF